MSAALKFLLSACVTCVATVPDVCDETCLFQKDLKVAHRRKASIADMEKAAEVKSQPPKKAHSLQQTASAESGRAASESNVTAAEGHKSQERKPELEKAN